MVASEFPDICLIRNAQNAGFAKATNQGIKLAKGSYILLLNSDTIVRPNAIDAMAEFMQANAFVGGVACKLLNEDGTIQASISNRPGPMLLLFRLLGVSRLISADQTRRRLARYSGALLGGTVRSYLAPYVANETPIEVENISAACLMLQREAIDKVGFLDERFFMYLEDADYCLRLRQAGWKLYYLPTVEIIHLSGRSSGGRMRNYSVHSYRALFQFYRKHFSFGTVLTVRTMVATLLSFQWVLNWIKGRFRKDPVYRENQRDLGQIILLCFGSFG
jgi:GT2 family glycosyltransferase